MRARVMGTVGLLVVGACTFGGAATTTTTSLTPGSVATTDSSRPADEATTTQAAPVEMPVFDDDTELIEADADVTIDTLENGLTYYIRENETPGLRAQLYLVVKAGSVHETDEQAGAAHFVEHMMFNGTELYPANDLLVTLQEFGAEFGPDVNAYTSREETVYQLELPTDNAATVEAGIEVLHQWASAATLDEEEVDRERGVLVEEWRLRDQQFFGRYAQGVSERLLEATPYENSEPLATPAQLEATTAASLRSFYETWYRPDLMAVVAVGDFDASDIEELITEYFGTLVAPSSPPDLLDLFTVPSTEPSFYVLPDPEASQPWVELNYPVPVDQMGTVGERRRSLALDVAWSIIETRLSDDALGGSVPFYDAARAANPLVRTHSTQGMLVFAEPENLTESTEYLLTEMQRAQQFGFTDAELDRAVGLIRNSLEFDFEARNTIQDREYAQVYTEHFLGSDPLAEASVAFDLDQRLLNEMSREQVRDTLAATIESTEPFVIIVSPANSRDVLPSEDDLLGMVKRAETEPIDARTSVEVLIGSLMDRLDGGEVERMPFSDLNITELKLDNGARVILLDTQIREGVVVLGATSPGGWSVVNPNDVTEAQLAPEIVTLSGVGEFDQVTLNRFLSDKTVSVTPFVDEVDEGFLGESSTDDLETMLSLVHLYMTEPNFTEAALSITTAEYLPFAEHPEQTPQLAVENALMRARFSGDPNFAPLPTGPELLGIDLEAMEAVYRDRFDDAGDFVFAFAGDFSPRVLEQLAADYLGTLPAGDVEQYRNNRPDVPEGIISATVEAGTGSLGGLNLWFASEREHTPASRAQLALLEQVLALRLTATLREELSATYSPSVSMELTDDPVQSVELRVSVSANPLDLDSVREAVLAELSDLARNGPTSSEFSIAQEQLRREYELFSNQYLRDAFLFYATHPNEPVSDILYRADLVGSVTTEQLRDLFSDIAPTDRFIEVQLVPTSSGG